jgi:hypothetical protein
VKQVPRDGRPPASFLHVLSSRSVLRRAASVPSGTPAAAFVDLWSPRRNSVQRPSELLRGVALRPVAYACRTPRNTLLRVLANLRRTARRKTFQRISERFAGQGLNVLGLIAGFSPAIRKQSVEDGGSSARKLK